MTLYVRQTDKGDGCGGTGRVTGASSHFLCRGQFAAKNGDEYTCSKHGKQKLISGRHWVLNGQPMVRVGDKTTCGATMRTGGQGTNIK